MSKIVDIESAEDEQPRKKKQIRFRDPETKRRKKRNWSANSSLRVAWNQAVSHGDTKNATEPPHGLNKLGKGNVQTLARHGNTPRHRPSQNHPQRDG